MNNMIRVIGLVSLLTAIGVASPSKAAPPIQRVDCAFGYFDASFNEELKIESLNAIDTRLNARGRSGQAMSCSAQIWDGLYAYGEYGEADGELQFISTSEAGAIIDVFDMDITYRRLGFGYIHSIGDAFSLYGQIGWAEGDYDFEPIFMILDSDATQHGSDEMSNSTGGLDVEFGIAWSFWSRFELSGFVRFAENNSFAFDEDAGPSLTGQNEDDVRVGARTRYRIADPVFISAETQFGEVDTLFFGLGVLF